MRVVLFLSKFYNWDTIPRDVKVEPEDIASGKVMPDRSGGYRVRVVKTPPGGTTRSAHLSEALIIAKIIEEKCDRRKAGRTLSRKQAVAHLLQDQVLEGEAEWSWITKVVVHDDGPDEKLLRDALDPHTKAIHGRRGGFNIDPAHVEPHVKAYMEPADVAAHVDHLETYFGVRKAVAS